MKKYVYTDKIIGLYNEEEGFKFGILNSHNNKYTVLSENKTYNINSKKFEKIKIQFFYEAFENSNTTGLEIMKLNCKGNLLELNKRKYTYGTLEKFNFLSQKLIKIEAYEKENIHKFIQNIKNVDKEIVK